MDADLGFDLIMETWVEEIRSQAALYRHRATGARVLSMVNDDTNKVFGITFRTPPSDSTGVAHILEHSVLCGSRKYLVKEPFVELMKGSLQTFLNAFTFPDKTCYPVASENLKDFYNLIDVYLDAVFHPRISRHIFEQEGWHYELETPDAPLIYKGVVYNEMKGVYSSPEDVLGELSQQSLFPDTTYGVDSGGNPLHIPELTYEQFLDFHRTLYHPSNAYIYIHGDDDPLERLRLIGAYLDEYESLPSDTSIPMQPRRSEPVEWERYYDPGQEEEDPKAFFTINWLLPESTDIDANLALSVLCYSLIDTSAGPLRKALIDSGLGEDLTGPGFANFMRQMYFGTGLRGIRPEDIPAAEALIVDTLRRVADEGLDPDIVEAALNTIEFKMRERNTGGYPRGLAYMISALGFWLYDADPLEPLRFEAPLARLRERIAAGDRVFEDLIRVHFLENPHQSRVRMRPRAGYAAEEEQAEQARLEAVRASLRAEDLAAIRENTCALKAMQETPDAPEALAAIPHLALSDLSPEIKTDPIALETRQDVQVFFHDLYTNGILYLDIGFDFRGLPPRLLPLLPVFGAALLEMGTRREDYVSLSNRIGKHTGGINPSSLISAIRDSEEPAAWLVLRGKAVAAKTDELLAILSDVLTQPNFGDRERFRQILLEEKAGFESSLIPSGHSVADTRLRAGYGIAHWVNEQTKGVSNLFFLRDLIERMDTDWASIEADLESIRRFLFTRARAVLNITVDGETWSGLAGSVDGFLAGLPAGEAADSEPWPPPPSPLNEGLTIPSQVNYVAKGANIYRHGYRLHGSAAVVSNLLRAGYLWDRIRVQGGAYGAFCSLDHASGVFTFGSYRDPNLADTIRVYDHAAEFLRDGAFSTEEIAKSIIGAIGSMDTYRLPDARGYLSMVRRLTGQTDSFRQQFREELLGATPEQVRAFADAMDAVRDHGSVVVVGAKVAIEQAGSSLGPHAVVTPIL